MKRTSRCLVLALAATLLLSLAGCGAILGEDDPQGTPTPTPTRQADSLHAAQIGVAPFAVPGAPTIGEVANRVRPAVVQVTNQQQVQVDQFRGAVLQATGIGSGVIYDASGLILTNDHVVLGADRLVVALPDGRTFDAQLVGTDQQTDLAVLRISGQGLPVALLGTSSNLAVGDWVVAIGNALGLAGGPTVTQGIVSALNRAVYAPATTSSRNGTPPANAPSGSFLFNLIQTDAPINPGNSGGPLVNLQAQVVGINTLVAASTSSGLPVEGIGFAISIDTAKGIAEQLVSTGRVVHPYLGVEYVPLNPALAVRQNLAVQRGMYVIDVQPNSPAERAGIQDGDVIVNAADEPLDSESSLARVIDSRKPGDTIPLTVVRDDRRLTVQVTLAQQPG